MWLIRSIHQRQRTIYKVTESIIKFQRDFFEKGIAYLRPLILRDVANDIGMHESTISRATSNKWVHTPQGLFELKYFFNAGINREGGQDDIAAESVKRFIKQLCGAEDPKRPYSDQKLVELLVGEGFVRVLCKQGAKRNESQHGRRQCKKFASFHELLIPSRTSQGRRTLAANAAPRPAHGHYNRVMPASA